MTVMMDSSSAADHPAAHSYWRGSRRYSPTECDVDDERRRDRPQDDRQVCGRWCGHDERVDVRQSRASPGEALDRQKACTSRRGHSSRLSTTATDKTRSMAYRTWTCSDPHRPTPVASRTHDIHAEVLIRSHEPSPDMSHLRSGGGESAHIARLSPRHGSDCQDVQWRGSHADPCPDEHVVVPLGVRVQLLSDHSLKPRGHREVTSMLRPEGGPVQALSDPCAWMSSCLFGRISFYTRFATCSLRWRRVALALHGPELLSRCLSR